jgi:hypothetical protein
MGRRGEAGMTEREWLLDGIERDLLDAVARIMAHLREDAAHESAAVRIEATAAAGSYRSTRGIKVLVSDARAWPVVEGLVA